MKQYILRKPFGITPVGTIVEPEDSERNTGYYVGCWINEDGKKDRRNFPTNFVENNPEWFKEKKELIFNTLDNRDVYKGEQPDLWWVAINKSDTIPCGNEYLSFGKFEWGNGYHPDFESLNYVWFAFEENAKKFVDDRKVILITEDGVKMVKGEKVWVVKNMQYVQSAPWTVGWDRKKEQSWVNGYHFFSSKEAAQDFVAICKLGDAIDEAEKHFKNRPESKMKNFLKLIRDEQTRSH